MEPSKPITPGCRVLFIGDDEGKLTTHYGEALYYIGYRQCSERSYISKAWACLFGNDFMAAHARALIRIDDEDPDKKIRLMTAQEQEKTNG